MNALGKPLRTKSDPKNEKKIEVKLLHVDKKSLARRRIFVQPPFSHSALKLESKQFTQQNHSFLKKQDLERSMSELGKLFLKRKMTSQTEISRNWMNE